MFRHNTWATLRLLDFCRTLTPAQLETASKGAFGSIRATLHHLISAEGNYYAGLAGAPVGEPLPKDATLEAMAERARELGARWEAVAADPGPLDRTITRPFASAQAAVVLIQAIHHGNEHRAQVASILGEIGVEPPALDAWRFGEAEGRVQFRRA
jgi:uncharacterized damage-inducible protein DinB